MEIATVATENAYGGIIIEAITETDLAEARTNPWKFRSASITRDDPLKDELMSILTEFVRGLDHCPCHVCRNHGGFTDNRQKPIVIEDACHVADGQEWAVLHFCCEDCHDE